MLGLFGIKNIQDNQRLNGLKNLNKKEVSIPPNPKGIGYPKNTIYMVLDNFWAWAIGIPLVYSIIGSLTMKEEYFGFVGYIILKLKKSLKFILSTPQNH